MPSRRVERAAPGTGRPVVFILFLLLATCAGCAQPGSTATIAVFELPAHSDPRKELIVRGVRLTGRIEARFEHGRTTLNGIELQPPPLPRGFMSPFDPYDTTGISDGVLEWLAKAPLVRRRMREGWTEPRAIHEYYGKKDSQLVRVTRVYRASLASGPEFAGRMARAVIDTELAVADSVGEHAPRFWTTGCDLYFHGYGWNGLEGYTGETRSRSPKDVAARLQKHGQDRVESIRTMMNFDSPILIICTYGTQSGYSGSDALTRFDDLDHLRRLTTPEERRRVLSTTRLLPQEYDELEAGGYFRDH